MIKYVGKINCGGKEAHQIIDPSSIVRSEMIECIRQIYAQVLLFVGVPAESSLASGGGIYCPYLPALRSLEPASRRFRAQKQAL